MAKNEVEILKKPYKRELWTTSQILEVTKCIKDPIYFVEKYMRVQHPTKGSVPLILYPYQKEMITAFKEHRNIVCLTGRQLGKCIFGKMKIRFNKKDVEIGSIIKLSIKDKLVNKLEEILVSLSRDS